MSQIINKVYKNNAIVYKVLLFLITAVAIVYLFPKGGQFKYDFNKESLGNTKIYMLHLILLFRKLKMK